MSGRPPPPSAFARTSSTSSIRTSSSHGSADARLSAIFVGKIPVDGGVTVKSGGAGSRPGSSSSSASPSQHTRRPSIDTLPNPTTTPTYASTSSAAPGSSSTSSFTRPPRSARRPSLQNGLPSPPFTSSEGSGGSTRLAHPPAALQEDHDDTTRTHTRPSPSARAQSEEDMDAVDRSLTFDDPDGNPDRDEPELAPDRPSTRSASVASSQASTDRDQRIRNIKDRVNNLDGLGNGSNASRYSSSATPSPTRSSYRTPPSTAALSSSTNSSSSSTNRRSSLPAPARTSAPTGRVLRPPLNNDSAWSASGGEETEKETGDAPSRSSGSPSGSSRAGRPTYSRAPFSGLSAEGTGSDYGLPKSTHSPSHDRASSLDLARTDDSLSRRSSRSGGGRAGSQHAQSHSLSSIDHAESSSPPPGPMNARSRDSPSLRTTALARSQSSSTSGSNHSSAKNRPALVGRQSSDYPVNGVLGAPTLRSRTGSPVSTLAGALSTLRISPSVRASRGSLASIAATAASRQNSLPSPRPQRVQQMDPAPPSATRSTFASRQARTSSVASSSLGSPFASPDKEAIGRSDTVSRRRDDGGDDSGAGTVDEADGRDRRERQSSSGKRRAPLPMEFRNDGSSSPPPPASTRNPRITTTAPVVAQTVADRQPRERSRRASPELVNASGASTVRETSSRTSRALPASRSRELREGSDTGSDRPRYTRRGGSAESALAERDSGRDLFSTDKHGKGDRSGADGTREILERIERETAEREIKKRQLLESQALRRAESSMALDHDRDRPESSISRTDDFNRRFPPRTPAARHPEGSRSIRQTPQTMAPLRPATSMAYTDDAPRTAPPGGHQLRSKRSIYNLQGEHSRQDASPSPSQQLRNRSAANGGAYDRAGTPTRASTYDRDRTQSLRRGAQTPTSHPRSSTSIDFPTSSSIQSNLSGTSSAPGPIANMVSAFVHLESLYSPSNLPCKDALLASANKIVSEAEKTNTSIAQVIAYTHQQHVQAKIDNLPANFILGLQEVEAELKDAKKTSDEEMRALTDFLRLVPRLGRELVSSSGGLGNGNGSDGGRDDRELTRVRLRHSSLEKVASSPLSRNESRRSIDFHARDASEPSLASRYGDGYTRPSTSQAYAPLTTSPSARFTRDSARPRLPSIPSVRQFSSIDAARAAADSSASPTVPPAPFPRSDGSPGTMGGGSPQRAKRTSVLGHVLDRFSTAPSSSDGPATSPDRTWRQTKLSSTSTVRATSLFPSGPKVSEPTTAISTVTANQSPIRSAAELPTEREYDDYDSPAPSRRLKEGGGGSGFLTRARTIAAVPAANGSSSSGGHSRRRTSFADEDEVVTPASTSRRTSQSTASGSEERRRRQSLPPGAETTSPGSGGSMFRRLGSFVGGGGGGGGGERLSPERRR